MEGQGAWKLPVFWFGRELGLRCDFGLDVAPGAPAGGADARNAEPIVGDGGEDEISLQDRRQGVGRGIFLAHERARKRREKRKEGGRF